MSALAVAGAAAPAGATTNLVTNGSFETPAVTSNSGYQTYSGGDSTDIAGWTVTGSSVDVVGSYWTAEAGTNSVDLDGNGAGGLTQTFDTTAGDTYAVSFYLAGNPDRSCGGSTGTVKTMDLSWDHGTPIPYSFDTAGHSKADMGWTPESHAFTATGTSSTLSFTSTDPAGCAWGPVIDNVSVNPANSFGTSQLTITPTATCDPQVPSPVTNLYCQFSTAGTLQAPEDMFPDFSGGPVKYTGTILVDYTQYHSGCAPVTGNEVFHIGHSVVRTVLAAGSQVCEVVPYEQDSTNLVLEVVGGNKDYQSATGTLTSVGTTTYSGTPGLWDDAAFVSGTVSV